MTQLSTRREFLEFLGVNVAALAGSCSPTALGSGLAILSSACASNHPTYGISDLHDLTPLPPARIDDFVLSPGLRSHVVISWNDPLNRRGDRFGYNNDFLATVPVSAGDNNDLIL